MPHNRLAVLEQLDLARKSGVRLQLSHLIFEGRRTWPTCRFVLDDIGQAAADNVDVSFDAFPYTYGNTRFMVFFPKWFPDDFAMNINDPDALRRLKGQREAGFRAGGKYPEPLILMWGRSPELTEFEGLDLRKSPAAWTCQSSTPLSTLPS